MVAVLAIYVNPTPSNLRSFMKRAHEEAISKRDDEPGNCKECVDLCDREIRKNTVENPAVIQAVAKCIEENGEEVCKQQLIETLTQAFIQCYGICDSSFKNCDWGKKR